ncbi:MAG: acetylglucosamine transferase [Methylibium sp. NZG]|nr:MAG: acetylglucosamine transferase [Methylibium sp. NZG]
MSTLTNPTETSAALEREIALACSGAMQLTELMERAQALHQIGLAEASARLYESWIAHTDSPLRHVACFNWGTVLGALRRHAEAEAAYRQALGYDPGFLHARLNLGHQLEQQGQPAEALAQWQLVVDQTPLPTRESLPLLLHALNNLARLCEQLRRFDEAEAHMVRSLTHNPAQPDVVQHCVHIRQKQCEWPLYADVASVTPNQLLVGTSPLAMLSASDDPALQLMAAQRFVHERVPKPPAQALFAAQPLRTGRIKVGYLSGDLCLHAVGLLTPELFELHDRSRIEVYGFCWSREDGTPQRKRLVNALDRHVPIGHLSDGDAAQLIASLGIDVLVDLQGLTSGARPAILGFRAAPVQVSYLGFPGTSALPGVDWMIADRFVMPPELLPYCTEKPLYLNGCYQVSDRQRDEAPTPQRATYGLPDDAFVFCSFNNNFKFTEEVFKRWMRILHAVPNSVLWLLADNEWARENMLRAADAQGVARERLIFAPRVSPAEYLARFRLADLVLDTFPYNAGTTASDALWMGTPILTCSGRTYISRMAGSLLTHVGLPDLVTTSLDGYEQLAVQLGRNPLRIASYKRYLAEHGRQSALFDIPTFVRGLDDEFVRLALAARS